MTSGPDTEAEQFFQLGTKPGQGDNHVFCHVRQKQPGTAAGNCYTTFNPTANKVSRSPSQANPGDLFHHYDLTAKQTKATGIAGTSLAITKGNQKYVAASGTAEFIPGNDHHKYHFNLKGAPFRGERGHCQ